ncbi:MAG TPA: hypothetical protein EYM68_13600 [Gammaproteobacteria bacterium]|jgi:ureidoglycolate lyase|nr:hypothetical protein [Gammaproteobacteria bacterium]|tara:strand:- start:2598 stop:3158 length:561 start_codon:yes stop_codon:yes gene_type:complete
MTSVQLIKVEPMTKESFEPFGQLLDSADRPGDRRIISPVEFTAEGKTTLGVIWQPFESLEFKDMERHFGVTQTFIQLSGSPAVVAVAPLTDPSEHDSVPRPEQVRAFLIDPARGFVLRKGTWHSLNRYILSPPGATFVILNSSPNPTQMVDYANSVGSIYSDLGSDDSPDKIDYENRFGVTFKLTL